MGSTSISTFVLIIMQNDVSFCSLGCSHFMEGVSSLMLLWYKMITIDYFQNSLRHSLSKSGYFVMVNRSANPLLAARKNHHWKIDPSRAVDLLSSMDKHYNRIIATHSILRGENSNRTTSLQYLAGAYV